MSCVLVDFTVGKVALVAGVPQTVVQAKNAANHRFKVHGWEVSFEGVSPIGAPVFVEICKVASSGGDGTSSSLTGQKKNPSLPETVQTAGLQTFTVEPSTVTVLKKLLIHPQGEKEWIAPYGDEYQFGGSSAGADTGRVALRLTALANVNCCATLSIEE